MKELLQKKRIRTYVMKAPASPILLAGSPRAATFVIVTSMPMFPTVFRVFGGLLPLIVAGLLDLNLRAQDYYQKDAIELELNHPSGDDAFVTFTRRSGTQPAERLAIAIPVTLQADKGETGAGVNPELKVSLRPGEVEVAASATLENGKSGDVLSGVYHLVAPADRAAAQKTRSENLDAELNRVYGEVRGKLPPARAATLKDLQREWIHSVYTPEPTAAPSDDSAGDHWCSLADHAAERIRFLQDFGAGHAASGPPSLQAQLRAAEDAEAWPSVAEIARHMLANTPKDSALWEKRARAFAKAEDWTRCGEVVEEWAKATQQKLPAMDALRGDVAEAEDRDEDAITAWKACLQAAPKDVETRDKLSEMLEDYNGWAESLPVRELRVKFQPTADSLAKLAVCYGTNGNWKAASAAIRRASAINATDDSVHDTMPKVERAEKEAPAIAKLDAAITAAPKSVEPPLERGIFFLGLGWPEITFRDAAAAEKLWPDSRGALVAKAAALFALGRKEDALELPVNLSGDIKNPSILRALAKADGDLQSGGPNASILGRRAHELNRARQYDLALEDCAAALKLDPNSDAALAARGEALNATGDDWKALPDVKRATEINPHNSLAWYVRGVIESKHHNFVESADAFSKVLELHPNDREALAFREKSYRALGQTTEADADAAHNKALEKK